MLRMNHTKEMMNVGNMNRLGVDQRKLAEGPDTVE
jgi:hypothetical protein